MRRPRILLVRIVGDLRDFWLGMLYFALALAACAAVYLWQW